MGGSIDFSSEPGVGSEFSFHLDCAVANNNSDDAGQKALAGIHIRVEADAHEEPLLVSYLGSAGAVPAGDTENPDLLVRDDQRAGLRLIARDGMSQTLARPVRYKALIRQIERLCRPVETAEPQVPRLVEPIPPRFCRLLVAEDHEVNRKVIRHQLEKLGFSVDIVEDGSQALLQIERSSYAMIYTDLHMPGLDGIALVQKIRQREASGARRVPVVALTADVLPSTRQRCLDAGFDEVMSKPMSLSDHERVLARWVTVG